MVQRQVPKVYFIRGSASASEGLCLCVFLSLLRLKGGEKIRKNDRVASYNDRLGRGKSSNLPTPSSFSKVTFAPPPVWDDELLQPGGRARAQGHFVISTAEVAGGVRSLSALQCWMGCVLLFPATADHSRRFTSMSVAVWQ